MKDTDKALREAIARLEAMVKKAKEINRAITSPQR